MDKPDIEYSTIQVTEAALPQAIKLAASHFPPGHPSRNTEYLRWLYLNNPKGPATLVLAKSSGRWVGMLALIPIDLLVGARKQRARFCVNVLSHPDFRGNNIFVNLIKASKALLTSEDNWLLGHPNSAAVPGWKRQKMNFRGPLKPVYLWPKLPFSRYSTRAVTSAAELENLPWSEWNQYLSENGGVRLDYCADFIQWRYIKSAGKQYSVNLVEDHVGQPVGLFVMRSFKLGVQLVIDWVGCCESAMGAFFPPRLAMVPDGVCRELAQGISGWRLPAKRTMPIFASTWGLELSDQAFCKLTLGASDL
jgi:hypothetical protein